jgi:hypothetical protein
VLTPAHGAWTGQIMAAHQLDDTFGKRNSHTLGWFCRCTIKEYTRYLAMPVCADAAAGWPAGKAAADPLAAGVALQLGHGPDPGAPVEAAGGQPGAVRADRHRGDKLAVADLGQLLPAGHVPGPDAGAAAGAAGCQPGAVRADCHCPDRRAGPDANHGA